MLLTTTIENNHSKLGITIRLTLTGMIQLSETSPYCSSAVEVMKRNDRKFAQIFEPQNIYHIR